MHLSSALSTMINNCVTPLFVLSSCVEYMDSIFLRPVFTFSLNVHFILCKLTVSDISTFFISVEFHIVDDIFACISLTLTMASLLKIYTAILMMNKILQVLYIPILILLFELVTAPMIQSKNEGNPALCPHIRTPSLVQTTDQWVTLSISIYCIVVYSLLHSAHSSWLCMHSLY